MNAFDQADSIVQLMSGLLGVAVVGFIVYRIFRKRKS
jgi:hypothetical protein